VAAPLRNAGEVAVAAVFALYLLTIWTLWRRPAVLSRAVAAAGQLTSSSALRSRVDKVKKLEDQVYTFAARRRHTLLPLGALELAFHTLGVLEVHVTLWLLLGDAPPLITSFLLETVNRLIIVAFKFMPMGLFVNEAGTAYLTGVLGLGTVIGTTIGLVRKVRILCWTAVGTTLLMRRGLSAGRVLAESQLNSRD